MVKAFTVATLIILGGSGIIAQASERSAKVKEEIYFSNLTILDLRIDQKQVGLNVSYPGKSLSGVCGLEIRTARFGSTNLAKSLLSVLEIKPVFQDDVTVKDINDSTIEIDLGAHDGSYGVWLTLATKDGSTIAESITKIVGDTLPVIVVPTTCK